MKKLGIMIIFILALALLVGCDWAPLFPGLGPVEPEPVEVLSADVVVTEWEQLGEYDEEISVVYLMTNTGTVNIDFSKILLEVTYGDLTKDVYTVWIDSIAVEVGCYESGYAQEVWVGNREVVEVVATEWELASYDL